MSDIYLHSKLEMAKTLHNYGVELSCIAVATGLTKSNLLNKLKISVDNDFLSATLLASQLRLRHAFNAQVGL